MAVLMVWPSTPAEWNPIRIRTNGVIESRKAERGVMIVNQRSTCLDFPWLRTSRLQPVPRTAGPVRRLSQNLIRRSLPQTPSFTQHFSVAQVLQAVPTNRIGLTRWQLTLMEMHTLLDSHLGRISQPRRMQFKQPSVTAASAHS